MSTLSEEIDAMVNRLDTNGSKFVSIAMQGSITILLKKLKEALERNERDRPRIVCLCGSTRFSDAFREANLSETLAGRIVLSVGCYMHADGVPITAEQKIALDILHKQKIDLADEILVLNVSGYIGDSTKSEIAHAQSRGKVIRWLEPCSAHAGGEGK